MDRDQIFANLNPAQCEAVSHIEGPLLTLAGPGSGKTRVVTHRIANLMMEGVSPHSILALTFTNKAASEMKKRLQQLVGPAPVWMGTFHGYCARFLRRYHEFVGLPIQFSIFDPTDAKEALKQAVAKAGVQLTHLNIDTIQRDISDLKNKLITPDAIQSSTRNANLAVLSKIYPAYQEYLLQCGAVDFDDLLMHTAVLLRTNNELRSYLDQAHQFVLVDEYQDTNAAQYAIVRALAYDYPNLNVTGDPDQSIYGWRGASIANIMNFERDYPKAKVVRLEENYRSTPQILAAADSVIQHNRQRKAKSLLPQRPSGKKVRLATYATDRDEANEIANQIQSAILDEGLSPNDFAVLYRMNAQSRLMEQALLARRLNYQLIGGFRFYQRQEIKDLLAYLKLVMNASDDIAFRRVINTPIRGIGEKGIDKIQEIATQRGLPMLSATRYIVDTTILSAKAIKGARAFLKLYDELVILSRGPLTKVLQHLIKETDYITYLQARKTDTADNAVSENVNELLADANQIDLEYPEGGALEAFLEQVSLVSDTDNWDANQGKVTLMTLHSCKGLEFKRVFIIAVEHGILPHRRCENDPAQTEEERRLFFVGITRAEEQLQISMAAQRGFGGFTMSPASRFLMELPRLEIEHYDGTNPYADIEPEWSDDFGATPATARRTASAKRGATESDEDACQEVPIEWDEACQLAPEEIMVRVRNMKGAKQTGGRLRLASEMEAAPGDLWKEGASVEHPEYGRGTIVGVSGSGLKRIAKIRFQSSDFVHSMIIVKSKLQLCE